jgi:hypothetical protein
MHAEAIILRSFVIENLESELQFAPIDRRFALKIHRGYNSLRQPYFMSWF